MRRRAEISRSTDERALVERFAATARTRLRAALSASLVSDRRI
jgi:hypothetical protein